MTELENATIAAQLTAALIAAQGRIASASVPPGTTQITVTGLPALTAQGAADLYREMLELLTQSAP